jgi:hypothetical protein
MVSTYIYIPLINTHYPPKGLIIIQPENPDYGGDFRRGSRVFDGPRAPKAHLDTVLTKPVAPPGQALYICGAYPRGPRPGRAGAGARAAAAPVAHRAGGGALFSRSRV